MFAIYVDNRYHADIQIYILPDRVVAPSKGRYQNQLQKSNMESRPALRLVGGKHSERMLLCD